MEILYFTLLLFFGFVPGIVNDFRLVKNMPWDSVGLSVGLCYLLHNCAVYWRVYPALCGLCLLGGLTLASLERFVVGFVFHCTKRIELWHEDFHEQLRKRYTTKVYIESDHLVEVAAYAAVFTVYTVAFNALPIPPEGVHFFWIGILLEHYIGLKVRCRGDEQATAGFGSVRVRTVRKNGWMSCGCVHSVRAITGSTSCPVRRAGAVATHYLPPLLRQRARVLLAAHHGGHAHVLGVFLSVVGLPRGCQPLQVAVGLLFAAALR